MTPESLKEFTRQSLSVAGAADAASAVRNFQEAKKLWKKKLATYHKNLKVGDIAFADKKYDPQFYPVIIVEELKEDCERNFKIKNLGSGVTSDVGASSLVPFDETDLNKVLVRVRGLAIQAKLNAALASGNETALKQIEAALK